MDPVEHNLASLRERHAAYEAFVAEEQRRPRPDPERLAALKRSKLWLKDQMEGLQGLRAAS